MVRATITAKLSSEVCARRDGAGRRLAVRSVRRAKPALEEGRVALVTGGGQSGTEAGVDFGMSMVLARHGVRVAVLDRDAQAAQRTVDEIVKPGGEAIVVLGDVTVDEQCRDAVAAVVENLTEGTAWDIAVRGAVPCQ